MRVRSTLEEMKYLLKFIFPFFPSGVEVKRGIEFCHSTRNSSRIAEGRTWGTECFNTRFALLCAGYSVKLIYLFLFLLYLLLLKYYCLSVLNQCTNYCWLLGTKVFANHLFVLIDMNRNGWVVHFILLWLLHIVFVLYFFFIKFYIFFYKYHIIIYKNINRYF